jgi:hypothetical protein
MRTQREIVALSGRIRDRAEALGWGVLWPDYFADEFQTPLQDVLAALAILEEQGFVGSKTKIRCSQDHEWAGSPAELPARCPVCDETYDDDSWVEVVFEKKKPQSMH